MSTNSINAQLLARAQQTAAITADLRACGEDAQRHVTKIRRELWFPVRPDLPTGQGSPTVAGLPAATVEPILAGALRERDETAASMEKLEEELAVETAKFKAELAAAAARSAPDVWNELPSGVEDMVKVAQEIMGCVGPQHRSPSRDLGYEEQHIVRDTPESVLQERADHAANLDRIAQLEAALESVELENKALLVTKQSLKEKFKEAKTRRRELENELLGVKAELGAHADEVEHLNSEIQTAAEQIERLEGEVMDSRAEQTRLATVLTEREAKMAEDDRTSTMQIGMLEDDLRAQESELRAAHAKCHALEHSSAEGLADSKAEAVRLTKELERRTAELATIERGAQVMREELGAELATSRAKIESLEANVQEMAKEIADRDTQVQQLIAQATIDQEERDMLRNLSRDRGGKIEALEDQLAGLELTITDQAKALEATSDDHASTSLALQNVTDELKTTAQDADSLTRQVADLEERLSAKSAEAAMLSDQLRDTRTNLAARSAEATSSASKVESLAAELHAVTRDRDGKATEAQRLAGELMVKAAEVGAQDVKVEMLSKALQEKAALVDQFANQLTARTDDLIKASQRTREEADKGDELRRRLDDRTKEAERTSQALQEKTAEVGMLTELIEERSESLREQTAKANGLVEQLQTLSSKADDLSARLVRETTASANKGAEATELADKCRGLSQQLEERDAAAKALSGRLQREEDNVQALQGELQAQTAATNNVCAQVTDLQVTVAEMCARMMGKQLQAAQWVEMWMATREQAQIPAEEPSTRLWSVSQSFTHDFWEPQVSGLPMLCLHLTATIRAGEWGNEAIALANLLIKELNSDQPLPVDGLLLVVSATVDGARDHTDDILLLAIWQLAVILHEGFRDEPRFGLQREALDEELQHSPWCQRVTQAIVTDSLAEMCGGEDGQLWSERGMGVLLGPRKHLFVAFNFWERRLWLFHDETVEFRTIPPTTSGIVIPGVEEPLLCIDRWWSTSYNKY
ncbi:hypothetical protein B0I37DRAFT_409205 [Chaetomium sp. MPI-CAGE-AT-0009]|nr:hypothetical protein B0I37DRAFT_409205 [Chaetomium sp. MPI-CAGE-AT-0009]